MKPAVPPASTFLKLSPEAVAQRILVIRGQKVMLDADLAEMYGVETKRLNEQVKRNIDRFPIDFMFQLTAEEKAEVVANCDHLANLKFSRALPFAFTEHGDAIRQLMTHPEQASRPIGFTAKVGK